MAGEDVRERIGRRAHIYIYVSLSLILLYVYYICVLLYMCPPICALILLYILPYMHTTICDLNITEPHTTICVLHMCTNVSSYKYVWLHPLQHLKKIGIKKKFSRQDRQRPVRSSAPHQATSTSLSLIPLHLCSMCPPIYVSSYIWVCSS